MLLLFPFHVTRVFNSEAFCVKAARLSAALDYILALISVCHMRVLFVLAGASTYCALRKRGPGRYLGERRTRLGAPFVMGVFLVLVPVQTWFGARFNSGHTDSFLHYLVSGDFLQRNIRGGGDCYGGFGFGHLWFIFVLLLVAVVALPLLADRGGAARCCAVSRAVLPGPSGGRSRRCSSISARPSPIQPAPSSPSTTSCSSCSGTSWSASPPS